MAVKLLWDEFHAPVTPGADQVRRWAAYNTVEEAMAQAAADDGMIAFRIEDEDGNVLADRKKIQAFADHISAHEKARDKAIEAAHSAFEDRVAGFHSKS